MLSNRYEAGKQGDLVELALLVETESALIQGGHIERVDAEPDDPKRVSAETKPAPKQKKED